VLPTRPFTKAGQSAWILLLLTMLFWGGGVPVSRLAVGEVSPMTIVCARWAIALTLLWIFAPKKVWAEVYSLRSRWRFLMLMGLAMTASNSLVFIGAKYTTGINLAILQGITPALVIAGAFLAYRARVSLIQATGVLITILGVILVATKGEPLTLLELQFNRGDIYQLLSAAIYAAYVVALRNRPAVSALAVFTVIAVVSFIISIPLMTIEVLTGNSYPMTWTGLAALLYIAIFVSMGGHIFFMRAAEMLGPSRAAMFHNLTPVIGATLSVLVLGEALRPYHMLAMVMVIAGIYIAESSAIRANRRKAAAGE
jgi:drug/metabolite transporter (DMT)-like permease